jgi:hypothetical protein
MPSFYRKQLGKAAPDALPVRNASLDHEEWDRPCVPAASAQWRGPAAAPAQPPALGSPRSGSRVWPSYQRCVDHAPPAKEGGRPDISRADFTWCLTALDWGFGVEETAERLMQESGKAYAQRTARNAGAALERRRGPRR